MSSTDVFRGCTTAEEVVGALEKSGAKRVHVGIFDIDTILREKLLPAPKAQKVIREGGFFSDVIYEWDIGETTYTGGAFADESTEVDPASGRRYPFAPDRALFLADFTGPHSAVSARNLAKAQIRRAAEMGYGVRAGFEYEFFVFDETPETLREKGYRNLKSFAAGNWAYSAVTPAVENEFLCGLLDTIAIAGIELDSFHTEFGPGCLEAPLLACEGIRAADDAALFKTFTKAYALRNGRTVSFMAKPSNDWPGQSGHLHLSLFDLATGQPVFGSGGKGAPANEALSGFAGGLLACLPEMLVMCAHTVNAYRRLVPGAWAPTHASWGLENRSCAVRAITEPAPAARIEFRVPAADSNPYLSLAACLAGGLCGIEERIAPPAPSAGDAYQETVASERRFPRNLMEAADRFRASERARALFGDAFVDWFARTREWEDRIFREHVSDLDLRRYLGVT